MPLGISKNLFQRIVSAVLLLPPVLGALWAGGWWFTGFLILGGILMAREWASLTLGKNRVFSIALSALVVLLLIAAQLKGAKIAVIIAELLAFSIVGTVAIQFERSLRFGWFLVGVAYVGMPMIAMWWLRTLDAGLIVLWVFFIVWATDIGGYFFGKGIGGPKLAPKLSPKKTWAGLLGGMAFSIVVGLFLHMIFGLAPAVLTIILVSGLMAAWAQAGDLLESGIKRHFDVKDSGELIPGHGGILDRVDGLVFVAPAMAMLLFWFPSLFLVS